MGRGPLRRSANVGEAFLGLKMLIPSPLRCSRGFGVVLGVFSWAVFFGFDWVVSLVGLLLLGFDF